MQCITGWTERQWRWGIVAHGIAVLGLLMLIGMGGRVESAEGWTACPASVMRLGEGRRSGPRRRVGFCRFCWRAGWAWMRGSWVAAAARSEALWALVFLSERWEWEWVSLVPWMVWVWKGLGVAWPELGRHALWEGVDWLLERGGGVAMVGLGMVWIGGHVGAVGWGWAGVGLAGGYVSQPSVEVGQDEAGRYHARLSGTFELWVDGNIEFYKRMLVVFLGLLEVPGERRGSRRTRDGRTPFVRQEQIAAWFRVPQPVISRWYGYWVRQDWRRVLSQRQGELVTQEMQQRVIESWVTFPWWSARQMWEHLRGQGSRITLPQVKQIARESGWAVLREALKKVYLVSAEGIRPRDEWLTEQLLAQVQGLVERVEELGGLTTEEQIRLADLETLCAELELHPATVDRPLPWVLQMGHWVFGHWERVDDGRVRCIYCGTTHVSRKSRQGRVKKYLDAQGKVQTVAVYRYYCHNRACKYKSFTNLPSNLIPYSRWTVDHHLAALQMYEWSHSVYRCTSQMLGVSKMTAYRWVSGFGEPLLPVAALFGVVRSSGVVGVDEKYVLVPKNDKPAAKMKRWMYVYLAVDCYTYDLLHIEIYPYNTKQSARAFLLALRAKGYHPRVVVTDMRVDYRGVVAQTFPKAVHHECIFHALQEVHEHFKEAYGVHYVDTHPEVVALREEINHIFDTRTKRTAQRRYEQVLAQRELLVAETPKADAAFAFLERHWPRLVNAIESRHIPRTNNATEQVIRIFTQHYKTFCGFESIASARCYLAVFEKVYRFTPFSDDAQKQIRGRCPLELAGYEVQKLPMAQLFRGLALQWPPSAFQELVPNV